MARPTRFWDRLAEKYARQPVADEAAYQQKLRVTQGYFRPDMEVLEFGCGTGSTALAHAPHVKHILATDFSAGMIAICNRKAEEAGFENVTFRQASVRQALSSGATYDAVLGLSILHLLDDWREVIVQAHGALKPGGIFVTSTVCLGDTLLMQIMGRFVVPVGRLVGLLPFVTVFTPRQLADAMTAAGFAIDHQWQPAKGKAIFIVAKKAN